MRTCYIVGLLIALSPHATGEQYAFLVGVRDYSLNNDLTELKFSENDVHELARTLYRAAVPLENITLMTQRMAVKKTRYSPRSGQIRKELALVLAELTQTDSIIVGFSGHGLQFKDDPVNYFCPSDADINDKSTLVSLTEVYKALDRCKASSKLLLVDACRNDPLTGIRKAAKLIKLEDVSDRNPAVFDGGTVALFSCSASQFSFEHTDLKHGVFFHFVNKALSGAADFDNDKAVDLFELESFTVKNVQKWARVNLGEMQTPERHGNVRGVVTLVKLDGKPRPAERMPIPPPKVKATPKSFKNSIGMQLNLIPAGSFMMGSPINEKDRGDDEHQHEVTLTKSFYLGATEVTREQWERMMDTRPWEDENDPHEGKNVAATSISHDDAVEFCKKISQKEAANYRLPTEAEWEYACRAGSDTAFFFGQNVTLLKEYAWYRENAYDARDSYTGSVAKRRPNNFGLFDMAGNAREWCSDWYSKDYYKSSPLIDPRGPKSGSSRVLRGGNWIIGSKFCRSANRNENEASIGSLFNGFRVVCE